MNQAMPPSMMMRKMSASDRPMRRAHRRCSGAMRETMTEMNTTLSMPSTISIALKAMKLAQIWGSVSHSSISLFPAWFVLVGLGAPSLDQG